MPWGDTFTYLVAKSMAPSDQTSLIWCKRVKHFDLWMHTILSCLVFWIECICKKSPPTQRNKTKQKSRFPKDLLYELLHCFVNQVKLMRYSFFFTSQDIHHISVGLTDQSQRTHWRWYLLYLFMKLRSSRQARADGWMLSGTWARVDAGGAKHLFTPPCQYEQKQSPTLAPN